MKTITLEVDDLDHDAIMGTIAEYQVEQRVNGELSLPEGEGDLRGRILAEICRGWVDLMGYMNDGEGS